MEPVGFLVIAYVIFSICSPLHFTIYVRIFCNILVWTVAQSHTQLPSGIPKMKRPRGLKSGERGGHSTGPIDEEICCGSRLSGRLPWRLPLEFGGP
jgi:hypothetical protein